MIEVAKLEVVFQRWGQRVRAVDGVDLKVTRGQWLLLVGHNGSGKSTLLRALAGLQPPTSGSLRVDGRPLASDRATRCGQVYLVRQDPLLGTAPMLTVFENLLVGDPGARGVGRKVLAQRYGTRLEPLGLATRLHQLAGTLSGGERQLLALLIASLQPAPALLLDEPFAALDPERVERGLELLQALHNDGRTLVQVSHDQQHIEALGDRRVRMEAGRIIEDTRREDGA